MNRRAAVLCQDQPVANTLKNTIRSLSLRKFTGDMTKSKDSPSSNGAFSNSSIQLHKTRIEIMRVCRQLPTRLASRIPLVNIWLIELKIVTITILPAVLKWRWLRETQEQQRPQCIPQLTKGAESAARITDQ